MSIFKRLTKEEIRREFTHYASIHGAPIYFNGANDSVCVRNWIPEFSLDFMEAAYSMFLDIMNIEDSMYQIKITGIIKD